MVGASSSRGGRPSSARSGWHSGQHRGVSRESRSPPIWRTAGLSLAAPGERMAPPPRAAPRGY
eukprot:11461827-Alexandrium_andersonii.AAC.1